MRYARTYLFRSVYTSRLLVWSIRELSLLILMIEGLYLSERFIHILEMIIDQPISVLVVGPLLLWTAPELHIALPIVVAIAVYRVILRCREQREFMVLASSGQGISTLLGASVFVAVAAFALSLLISGFLFPWAKFAFRSDIFQIRYQAIRAGSTPGQFVEFPNYTIYIWPPSAGQPANAVFAKQIIDNQTIQVINAERVDLINQPDSSQMAIRLIGVTKNEFPNLNEHWIATKSEKIDPSSKSCGDCKRGVKSVRTVSVVKELDIDDLVSFDKRGVALDEWTSSELSGLTSPPEGYAWRNEAPAELLRRFARSLLCIMAPFVGWLTLTFTTRYSQAFALPTACAIFMCCDIGFSQLISRFGPGRTIDIAMALLAVTITLLVICVKLILGREHLAVTPALARS
jgi:lipopolysaccharide export LptBFGC system permease protein LptF